MAGAGQFIAQFAEIVDFAIADQPQALVFVGQRLVTTGQVDDGETAHADDAVAVVVPTMIIRATVPRDVAHVRHERRIGGTAVEMNDAVDAAHVLVFP